MNPLSDDAKTLKLQKTTSDNLQGNLIIGKGRKTYIFETTAIKRIRQEFNYWLRHSHVEFKCFLGHSASLGIDPPSKPQPSNTVYCDGGYHLGIKSLY